MRSLTEFTEFAKSNYKKLKKQTLGKVKRWIYATGPLFSIRPMFYEMLERDLGKEIPASKNAKFKLGFDANNQLIYSVEDVFKDGTILNEEFLFQESGQHFHAHFKSTYFQAQKFWLNSLEWIHEVNFNPKGKVSAYSTPGGQCKYFWEDSLLTCIEYDGKSGKGCSELRYDALGKLTEIWKVAGGRRALQFRRPPQGVSIKSIEPAIQGKLLKAITKMVAAAGIREPVYCLALAYDGEGNDVLPPCIGIGLDSERQKWMKEHGKDAKDFIWNPAEFTHYEKDHTQLDDKELDKACELLNDLLRPKENFTPAIKLLNAVAAELGKLDWKGKLKTTPDFVVYAVDFELADLKKNLKQSVPAAKLEKLKKAKLL